MARVRSLLFPVAPVACDQWRTRSSCFAVDACSCLLCSCPPCSCLLCSLPTAWIFLLSLAVVLTWPRRSVPRVPLLFRPPQRQSRLQVSCGCVCRPLCGVGHVGATERVLRETRRSGFSDPRRAGFVIIRTLLVSA